MATHTTGANTATIQAVVDSSLLRGDVAKDQLLLIADDHQFSLWVALHSSVPSCLGITERNVATEWVRLAVTSASMGRSASRPQNTADGRWSAQPATEQRISWRPPARTTAVFGSIFTTNTTVGGLQTTVGGLQTAVGGLGRVGNLRPRRSLHSGPTGVADILTGVLGRDRTGAPRHRAKGRREGKLCSLFQEVLLGAYDRARAADPYPGDGFWGGSGQTFAVDGHGSIGGLTQVQEALHDEVAGRAAVHESSWCWKPASVKRLASYTFLLSRTTVVTLCFRKYGK
ncbi:LOW QUALITY PROTEIN: hypothetical protein CRUP_030315 [Coryphaenoides rupestris]|nr:LOW QUALITY PROTEIN: hypothetical protein CRUP_030315 [Coryphaenoides rupestris]